MNPDKPRYPQTDIPPELAAAVLALATDNCVRCADARAFAKERGLDLRFLGYIMDELGLLVTDCGLGCF